MESDISEMNLLENLSHRACFLAGILKNSTNLELSIISNFLLQIYTSDLDSESLKLIESFLYEGKIGLAKQLLDDCSFECMICKKFSNCIFTCTCSHTFHKKCLSDHLISQCLKCEKNKCPICEAPIENLREISEEAFNLCNVEFERKALINGNLKLVECPNCKEIFEYIFYENFTCCKCNTQVCIECRSALNKCRCQKRNARGIHKNKYRGKW